MVFLKECRTCELHAQKWNNSCACVCGHGLILHLCNWMEDVSIHSLDVVYCECIPMHNHWHIQECL